LFVGGKPGKPERSSYEGKKGCERKITRKTASLKKGIAKKTRRKKGKSFGKGRGHQGVVL